VPVLGPVLAADRRALGPVLGPAQAQERAQALVLAADKQALALVADRRAPVPVLGPALGLGIVAQP